MKNKIVLISSLSFLLSSCDKFLDINENENDVTKETVTLQLLLPSAEAAIANVVGNNFQVFGGIYSQHWTQNNASSQYKTIEQYSPDATNFDTPWRILYADALKDLKIIEEKSVGNDAYLGISKILQAYTYQLLTDNFGDIPFKEALDATNVNPKYSTQEEVYDGIFGLIEEGKALLYNYSGTSGPTTDDIIFGGDLFLWLEFANTLQLKAALRLSGVNSTKAQQQITLSNALFESDGIGYLNQGESAVVLYSGAGGNSHPLNAEIIGLGNTENLRASKTTFNYFLSVGDEPSARRGALYEGEYALRQGDYGILVDTIYAVPSDYTGGNNNTDAGKASVRLMTDYESAFLQAEAIARGWLTGDDADLYLQGILLNYAAIGIDEADAVAYTELPAIAYPAGLDAKIERIITEKWAAMCGTQGIESWTEWRRTGYPSFFVVSANSLLGGSLLPNRLLYPSSEVTRNLNFPGQPLITEKLWWDVN